MQPRENTMSDIDKKYYPFNVKFINEGEGYLIEEISTEEGVRIPRYEQCYDKKTIFSYHYIYLKILNLKCVTHILDNEYSEELRGVANFLINNSSISFFGSNNKIREIDISILLAQNIKFEGFEIHGCLENEYNDEESLDITFALSAISFQKIKYLIDKKLIETINCSLNTKDIAGLYKEYTYASRPNYKILYDRKMVANIEELPESFKGLSDKHYRSDGCYNDFHMKIVSQDIEFYYQDKPLEDPLLDQSPTAILRQEIANLSSIIQYCGILLTIMLIKYIFF